jgi:hypothetical protein
MNSPIIRTTVQVFPAGGPTALASHKYVLTCLSEVSIFVNIDVNIALLSKPSIYVVFRSSRENV